jgi:diguanylate cyclase (GGDEF)-like protein
MSKAENKPVILLITQSSRTASMIEKLLRGYFTSLKAEDAESGWNLLVKLPVAVIACDLSLAIDKFGLLERIRNARDRSLATKPVLLLIGEQDQGRRSENALVLGATDFINMPFSSAELISRVRFHAGLFSQLRADPTIELEHIPSVNELTQLTDEKFFRSRLQHELSFSLRHKNVISICKFRVNGLKQIVADFDKKSAIAMLHTVARIIQETMREEDVLSYLGNADFCLLYPATNGIEASAAANRILKNIGKHDNKIDGKTVPIVISGAINSSAASEDTTVEKLMGILDELTVRASSEGDNKIVSMLPPNEKEYMTVERALKYIEHGASDGIKDHLSELLLNILPLLEHADQTLDLELESVIKSLQESLGKPVPVHSELDAGICETREKTG